MRRDNPDRPPHAVIISAAIGAGHDGAAEELARRLGLAGFSVDRHDLLDLLPPLLGTSMRASYRTALKIAPRTWDRALGRMNHGSGLGRSAVRFASTARRRITRAIGPPGSRPDVVVSTYPLASQALGELRVRGALDMPIVTFLTDMSVHPLWIHAGADLHLALHEITAGQAQALGAANVRVVAPAVRPAFHPDRVIDDAGHTALRHRFHLPAGRLALVVAGSWGVGEIAETVCDIAETGIATPVVACGRNDALRVRLRRAGHGPTFGWIGDMPDLINACDVVVQNAGGLTSLEAIAVGVPVLTYRCLVGHGRTNADALHRAGWAPWITDLASLPAALTHAFSTPRNAVSFTGMDPIQALCEFLFTPGSNDANVVG